MGGLVGLTPEQVGTAVSATEAMKTGPVERAYKQAVTEKLLEEPTGLTFEQKKELARIPKDVTPEERDFTRAGTKLRNAQARMYDAKARAEGRGDLKTSQMYDDANAYYDDLYNMFKDEFGVWKGDMWYLDQNKVAGEGSRWKDMTASQVMDEIAKMRDEDNARIWRGKPPRYATGTKGSSTMKREADIDIGGLIDSWNQGR